MKTALEKQKKRDDAAIDEVIFPGLNITCGDLSFLQFL
jgi:hypothetical protein